MTKYFCIGLQRTGTTSLHQAALLLGIRSAPMSADLLYDLEAPLIDQYDLFSDNPIPLLYQKLDKAYPNSKFILTTRPIEGWLKSVEWLFTHDKPTLSPEFQEIGDDIHQRLYGRTTFDELVFRAFWHSYHAEVDSYFANRPGDLLRLNFSAGDGWEKLCPFLDVEIPVDPFPHTNKRRKKRWWQF
ncbi:MAG: sulfotransferase family protein [Chloroflexota bacterium]